VDPLDALVPDPVLDLPPRGRPPDETITRVQPRAPIVASRLQAHAPPHRPDMLLRGRYRLLEQLGAGGFGVVWRAQDELLHREIALKRIPLPPETSPSRPGHPGHGPAGPLGWGAQDGVRDGADRSETDPRARAGREARAAARLAHPAIVALYEAFFEADAFYLISELVHGETLAALIATGELSDQSLLEIGLAMCLALGHAHERGVIHRDVKPQNVLVPQQRSSHETPAKLTDFGGASLSGIDALTLAGETLGTLAYMAPEQCEGRAVDERTDLYSLALVLYEGLTGANPVRGATPADTARRIGHPLPPLATVRPDLPHALAHALDTALEPDPGRRGTLAELQLALERTPTGGRKDAGNGVEGALRAPNRGSLATRSLRRRRALRAQPVRMPGQEQARAEGFADCHDAGDESDQRAADASGELTPPTGRRVAPSLPLSRAVWAGCVLAGAIWLVFSARPGLALLVLAAAMPLWAMGTRPGAGWLAAALAPLLGVIGLAGAYPALAGQALRWGKRAILGALGYWWLILAQPLLAGDSFGGRLWLASPPGLPPRAVWEGSLQSAAVHVLAPALSAGVLFGAILWAAGAAMLPWVVRGRSALLDTLAAVVWSVALLASAPYLDAGLPATGGAQQPRGAVLAAFLGAAIVVAARALRGPISLSQP
jgi:eukaryotic-like serine/threonine-protein kinase